MQCRFGCVDVGSQRPSDELFIQLPSIKGFRAGGRVSVWSLGYRVLGFQVRDCDLGFGRFTVSVPPVLVSPRLGS